VGIFGLTTGATMQKLLEKYRANPSSIRHAAVISYHRKHPFCECFLNEADLALCRLLTAFDITKGK
jgi:hypothetical protein